MSGGGKLTEYFAVSCLTGCQATKALDEPQAAKPKSSHRTYIYSTNYSTLPDNNCTLGVAILYHIHFRNLFWPFDLLVPSHASDLSPLVLDHLSSMLLSRLLFDFLSPEFKRSVLISPSIVTRFKSSYLVLLIRLQMEDALFPRLN